MRPNLLVVGCALVAGCSSVPQLTPIAHPDVTVVAVVGSAALAGFYYPLRAPSAQGRKDCSD